MPKKNNKLNQYLKELEENKIKVLSMSGSQINSNILQTFMEMKKEIIKEMNKKIKSTSELKNIYIEFMK
jgi:hypothetical protein